MGLIDKLKNMFTEEVEEEEEKTIKKDVIQVEIPAPSRVQKQSQEPIKNDPVLEEIKRQEVNRVAATREDVPPVSKPEPKKEEKFVFPVFFDDDDFKNIEDKSNKNENLYPKRDINTAYNQKNDDLNKPKKETKKFTPTPIISPIYGVLDKNYHKEDITSKSDHTAADEKLEEFSIDQVRKKAYGTLEDDLENNMYVDNNKFFEEEKNQVTADMFNDMDEEISGEEKQDEAEKKTVAKKIPSRVDKNKSIEDLEDNIIAEEIDKNYEAHDNNDSDLLNLIDSMYDEGGDK